MYSFKVFTCTFQTNLVFATAHAFNPCNVPYDNVPDDGDDDGPDESVYIHHPYLSQTTI